jgi:hypothetical protein
LKKGLEAIWRGSKLEIEGVLRDVCDLTLTDTKCSEQEMMNRLQALGIIAKIYESVTADEEET